jgi:hypothetical protein
MDFLLYDLENIKYHRVQKTGAGVFDKAGMIEPQASYGIPVAYNNPQNKLKVGLIATQTAIGFGTIYIIVLVRRRLKKGYRKNQKFTNQGYIFKLSRVSGKNEYEIFQKAAEDWPISENQIEGDFNRYLTTESIPYYVNVFVRKNKKHIDKLRISLFIGQWFGDGY